MVFDQSQAVSVAPSYQRASSQLSIPADSKSGSNLPRQDLLSTLTSALQSEEPLNYFVEALGLHLSADACLLIGYSEVNEGVVISRWLAGCASKQWQISATVPVESAPQQHHLAMTLIQDLQAFQRWPSHSEKLFAMLHEAYWWQDMSEHQVIPVNTIAEAKGVIVLMRRQGTGYPLPQELACEVSSWASLILYQQYLQQQARRSIEQLRYINHMKDDFLSTLSHELRTPLTSMMLAIRMLRRSDLSPERQAMYLDILEQQCCQETRLVNDLLTLRSLEASEGASDCRTACPVAVNVGYFLSQLVEDQRPQFDALNLTLSLEVPEAEIWVESDVGCLRRIFEELMTNARKYAEHGTQVRLSLRLGAQNETLVELTTLGCGILPEEIPHIFDKFRRGQGSTQKAVPGTGTGLALVKGLVRQLQGDISVASQPCPDHSFWATVFKLHLCNPAISKVG